jgi:hypothetical protein
MSAWNITKADIARELEKVSAGVYRAKSDPLFQAELETGRSVRRWRVTYAGSSSHDDRADHDLAWVVWRLRQIGVCTECGRHTGTRILREWRGRLGVRRVCQKCQGELQSAGMVYCDAKRAALAAADKYAMIVAIRGAPDVRSALAIVGLSTGGDP